MLDPQVITKTPNYKRQKFLLLLIKMAGGRLARTDLQKLLFLATRDKVDSHYEFVPYKFGCYSFQAADDLEILQNLGWIHVSGTEVFLREGAAVRTGLPVREIAQLDEVLRRYEKLRGKSLIRFVYCKHPYFAIHSEIAKDILDDEQFRAVAKFKDRIKQNKSVLFTIGYEGLRIESYINKLIENDVRLLCDVRQNPLSRKFGFSKRTLSTILPKLGIEYMHIPELGISSERRTAIETKEEFIGLFQVYRSELPQKGIFIEKLRSLLRKNKRVALTCFERHHQDCHRHCISDALAECNDVVVNHL